MLDDFPEEITETLEPPAASNFFNIRYDNRLDLLDNTRSQVFHHPVEQFLFTGIRCRKDAPMAIAFLMTIVRILDKDN